MIGVAMEIGCGAVPSVLLHQRMVSGDALSSMEDQLKFQGLLDKIFKCGSDSIAVSRSKTLITKKKRRKEV